MPFIGPKPADTVLDSSLIEDGAIVTADIADGAITNAKINSSAAIATSKITGLAASATTTMYCVYLGKATSTVNPPSGSVGSSQLANDAVTLSKLNLTYDTKTTASGDGSDTTFTINSGRAVDDVLVFVNGICLVPTDDYTISGTTLTFSTAPTNGAEISIRYLPK